MSPVITDAARRTVQSSLCLEIEVDGSYLRYSQAAIEESAARWMPLIVNSSAIGESLDPEGLSLDISPVQIELRDQGDDPQGPGYWGPLVGATEIQNRPATLSLKVREADGSWTDYPLYSGVASALGITESGNLQLEVRSTILERLGIAQRIIDKDRFSAAPDESLGLGMNIVLGTFSSSNGSIQCQLIDKTNRIYAVTQHGIEAVTAVNRVRGGVNTRLTAGSDYTVTKLAADGKGDPYSYVQIAAGAWQDGDQIFADLKGFVDAASGYTTLNGTTQYFYRNAANTNGIPGHGYTGSFTVQFKYRVAAFQYGGILSAYDGNDPSWSILQGFAAAPYPYLEFRGAGQGSSTQRVPMTNVSTGVVYEERWVIDFENNSVRSWRNNVELTLNSATANGATALETTSYPLRLGAYSDGSGVTLVRFNGRIYYGQIAQGAQPLLAGSTFANQPLTNVVCQVYPGFGTSGGVILDLQGGNHLTPVGTPTYTAPVVLSNPAQALRSALLSPDCWGLESSALDADSWNAAVSTCTSRGYAAAGACGLCVPEQPVSSGSPVEGREAPWQVIQALVRDFGHLLVAADGKLALRSIDPTTAAAGTLTRFSQDEGTLSNLPLTFNLRPLRVVNAAAVLYNLAQAAQSKFEGAVQAANTASQDRYGYLGDVISNRVVRNFNVLKDVHSRRFALSSGGFKAVQFNAPALTGFRSGCGIGDQVLLTHRRALGKWVDQPVLIVSRSFNPMPEQLGTTFNALTVGTQVGSTTFALEGTETVEATTTFVGASQVDDYDSDSAANAGYGAQNYLRLGHHFMFDGPWYSENANWRVLARFTLPSAFWAGLTIESVTIVLQVDAIPGLWYDYWDEIIWSGWSGSTLNKFTQTTWTGGTSFNALGGLGGYSSYVSTQLGTFPGGLGEKSIALLPGAGGGLEMFQKAAAGTGQGASGRDVNLCLGDFADGRYTNACRLAKSIRALVNYSAS